MSRWAQIAKVAAEELPIFTRAMGDPVGAQTRQLKAILADNQDSAFGAQYDFPTIKDIDTFRKRVPLHRYEDLEGSIRRMAAGERKQLCSAEVVLYEETSGSTRAAKLIPYTRDCLHAVRRALFPWLADLLAARPSIERGRAYFALGPTSRRAQATPDGTPLGVSNDADYFGDPLKEAFADLSVVPGALASLTSMDDWRYLTVRCLLNAEDLSLISVWSPTFLTPLLDTLMTHADRLVRDVEEGTVDLVLPDGLENLAARFYPDPDRAKALASALSQQPLDTQHIWPNLDTISCWTDASASHFVHDVRSKFPHAWIQGKGLLATEGVVTIPLVSYPYPVLALLSGLFEFLDSDDRSWLCHELQEGEIYRVILTTHGGLYRYDLGDRVLMRGWADRTPMLEFVGRAGLVSDLCGEKLTEEFVQERLPVRSGFAMLAPSLTPRPHYVLFLDAAQTSEEQAAAAAGRMDEAMQANPHYRHARRHGQLAETKACRVMNPQRRYVEFALEKGQQFGDIKPSALRPETDWERRFPPTR